MTVELRNEGRKIALAEAIGWIQAQRFAIQALVDNADSKDPAMQEAAEKARGALALYESLEQQLGALEEPVAVWECDARKGRPQWGKVSSLRARVTLDGQQLKNAVAADSRAGAVVVIPRDSDDKPVIAGGKIAHEVLYGKVTIEEAPL